MMSVFSKRNSTGLPAWTTSRSLSKSIWSGTRADADARARRARPAPCGRPCAWSGGSSAASASAELQGVERRRRGPLARPAPADVGDQAVEQRPGLVLRPVAARDALEGLDRRRGGRRPRVTNFASALNVVGLLAADGRSGAIIAARRIGPSGDRRRRPSNVALRPGPGCFVFSKTTSAVGVEHLEREVVEPLAEVAVGAVVDRRSTRSGTRARGRPPTTGCRCPPRCASGRRRRSCRSCCRRWPGSASPPWAVFFCVALPCAGDVPAVAEDLDLGQRQRPLPARQLDRGRSGRSVRLRRSAAGASSGGRPSSSGSTFGYRPARWPGSRISGIGVDEVAGAPATDCVASAQALSDAAVGRDQGDEAELAGDRQLGRRSPASRARRGRRPVRRRAGRSAGGPGRTRRSRPGRPRCSSWPRMASSSTVSSLLLSQLRQVGQRLAAELVADALAEEQLEVDRRGPLHLQQVVGADVLEEVPGRRRRW